MNLFRPIALGFAALLACSCALAQWQWLDKDGRKVFSDRAPPTDIPAKNILKQPGGQAKVSRAEALAKAPDVAASKPGAKDTGNALRIGGVDKDLEAKKKQVADAEIAKTKADEERLSKLRADNCSRARQGKATYDSGIRVARTNANGEREILDDTTRAAETNRIQAIIDADCR